MRFWSLAVVGALALALLGAACGDDEEKMQYSCTLSWSCNGEAKETSHQVCTDFDAPSPCAELIDQADESCVGVFTVLEGACTCEGRSVSSC